MHGGKGGQTEGFDSIAQCKVLFHCKLWGSVLYGIAVFVICKEDICINLMCSADVGTVRNYRVP